VTHVVEEEAPEVVLNVPMGQSKQVERALWLAAVVASSSLYFPSGQDVQEGLAEAVL
jgi:hypothetical protein